MEIETKYALDPAAAARLADLPELAGYLLGDPRPTRDLDRYVDTADHAILHAGYACRIRERNGSRIATLKSLHPGQDEWHTREEVEVVLPAGWQPSEWPPSDARDLALQVIGDAPLVDLFEIHQQRAVRAVRAGDRLVAEWSLDRASIHAGGAAEFLDELEIELKPDGTPDDLRTLAAQVRTLPGATPESRSKFERGLLLLVRVSDSPPPHDADRSVPPPAAAASPLDPAVAPDTGASSVDDTQQSKRGPGVAADDTLAAAGRKIMRLHLKRLLKHESGARVGDDIEAVHDMRVATRRLRAALALFGPYYKKATVRALETDLRRTTRRLGAVRDLDVILERAEKLQATVLADAADLFQPLRRRWEKHRGKARSRLVKWLDTPRYRGFIHRFQTFVDRDDSPSTSNTVAPTLVRHLAPAHILETYARVRAYDTLSPDAPMETLHNLRLEAKRFRYTLEFFSESLSPEADELIARVTALQDLLGNLQDADVEAARLREYLAATGRAPTPGTDKYFAALEDEQRRLHADLPATWKSVLGSKFRRKLGQLVGSL